MKNLLFITFIAALSLSYGLSQTNPNIDSLRQVLKTAKHDTTRMSAYLNWGEEIYLYQPDSALILWRKTQAIAEKLFMTKPKVVVVKIAKKYLAEAINNIGNDYENQGDITKTLEYYNKSFEIYEEIDNKKGMATTYNNIGYVYENQGDIPLAITYYNKSLKIKEEINDKKGIAISFNNLGNIYKNQGNIPIAIAYYNKSLKIKEEITDKKGMATSFNNLGNIYKNQGDFSKAMEYYNKCLKLEEEIGNKEGIAISCNNIGNIYDKLGIITKALEYYNKFLKLEEEIGNKKGMATSLNNIGSLYENQGDMQKASEYFNKSLKIRKEIGDKKGIAISFINIGSIYYNQNKLTNAQNSFEKSYRISKELGYPLIIEKASSELKLVHEKLGNFKLAYYYQKEEILMRDSIQNEENYKASVQQRAKYEYEKKAATDSIANTKEKEIKDAEIAQQQAQIKVKLIQQYGLIGGLTVVLIFAGFVFNRLKVTQRQKVIIEIQKQEVEKQKEIVEEKHKEITDSINYAERIQRSFLATTGILDQHLKDYFVFFRPKDVVSGDFYWAGELNNGNFAFSVADSTGHGVPGAIMSILNISSLEKSIEKEIAPDQILNKTRKIIIERLKKDGSTEGGKDGMDCSLLVFNQDRTQLSFAAANNPVFIVRNNELIEFKPDKMPVGKHDKDVESFTLHSALLQKGDVIYALTDGFPDQFGGEKGKKYMIKNLKELLLQIAHLPVQEQEQKLADEFTAWKGENEQVDDVCIIGVRV